MRTYYQFCCMAIPLFSLRLVQLNRERHQIIPYDGLYYRK